MAAQTRLARISFTHAGSSEDKLMRYMAPMTPPSFRALIAEVERKAELQPGQSITLKYTDNANKPINIRDDEDVAGAWEDAGTNPIDLFCVVNSGTTASIQASFDRLLEKRGKAPSGASSLLQSVASSKAPSPQGVGRPTTAVAPPPVVPPAAFAGPSTATRPVVPPQTSPSAPISVTPSREPSAAAAGGPSSSTSPSARAPPTAAAPPYATAASPSTPPYAQQAVPPQPAQPVAPVAPSPPVAFVPPTPAPAATGGRPPFVAAMAATASVAPTGPMGAAPGGRPPFVSAKAATTSLPSSSTGAHSAAPPQRTGGDVARLREGAPAASEAVVAMVFKQAGNNFALAANHLSVFDAFTTDDMKKPPTTKFEEAEVRKLQRVYPTFPYEKLRDVWRTNNGDPGAIMVALDNQGVRGR